MLKNLGIYLQAVKRTLLTPEVQTLFLLALSILLIGTVFYRVVEGWGWVDSFYFSAITLATVGYGDFSPQTTLGKLFTVGYIFIGFGVLATFLATIAEKALSQSNLEKVELPFSSEDTAEKQDSSS